MTEDTKLPSDEDIIRNMLTLLAVRVANDRGDLPMDEEDQEIWGDRSVATIFIAATRLNLEIGTMQ